RGLPRPQDGDGALGPQPDIGAFESYYGQIGGIVFRDRNGNGKRDANEPGLPGQVIYLDANQNGRYDSGEPVTKTTVDNPSTPNSEAGSYSFGTLDPTTHLIGLQVGAEWSSTNTRNVQRVSIASDGTEGNDYSGDASSISTDGRFVVFPSYASNLVSGDTN